MASHNTPPTHSIALQINVPSQLMPSHITPPIELKKSPNKLPNHPIASHNTQPTHTIALQINVPSQLMPSHITPPNELKKSSIKPNRLPKRSPIIPISRNLRLYE